MSQTIIEKFAEDKRAGTSMNPQYPTQRMREILMSLMINSSGKQVVTVGLAQALVELSELMDEAKLEQTVHLQAAEQKFGKVDWQAAIYELEPRDKLAALNQPNKSEE